MDDRAVEMEEMLRRVIWRRRRAFYAEAVKRGLITPQQAEALHLLHLERDDAQDRREGR